MCDNRQGHLRVTALVHAHTHIPAPILFRLPYPLLPALSGSQLGGHSLLHLPAVGHDRLQDGHGAGAHRPAFFVPPGDTLKVPLQGQEGVCHAEVAVALLNEQLLPPCLRKEER